MQARALGVVRSVPPATRYGSFTEAVGALLERRGARSHEGVEQSMARLADVPAPLADALARVVERFMAFEDAAARRDPGAVLGARQALLEAAAAASAAAAGADDRDGNGGGGEARASATAFDPSTPFQVSPWLSVSTGDNDDTYTTDFVLVIDEAGDDTYTNNAGGSNLHGGLCELGAVTPSPAAALVDLEGIDHYTSGRSCGANGGGAALGAGFLYDGEGDDEYVAGEFGTNGGGDFGGLGFLFDGSGTDRYEAGRGGTNGGGAAGVGLLVDGGGGDRYTAGDAGTNGGAQLGVGGLVDLGGGDVYIAGAIGTNGGAGGGFGFLLDGGGNDTYTADTLGVNGGAGAGSGLLLDAGGLDTYLDGDGGSGTNKTVVPKGAVGAQVDVVSP